MQEIYGLPLDEWAWINYQLEISVTCERYACKGLSAGGIAIALDIIKNKLNSGLSPSKALEEYERRVVKIFDAFKKEFGECGCQALLGFDAMKYDDYPPEKQRYIEGGEWMKKCCTYMGFIVNTMKEAK
ncbi:MAG: hypothetical protein ACYDH8_13960 [Syntrophales bacterium]